MHGRMKNLTLCLLFIPCIVMIGAIPASSTELYTNPSYGYEIDIVSPRFIANSSESPHTMLWQIGDTGRMLIEPVELNDEDNLLAAQDYADHAVSNLENNLDEFLSLGDGWFTSLNGIETYEITFEFYSDDVLNRGIARVATGDVNLMLLYYDIPSEFDYYIPDVRATFDSLRIDASLIDESAIPEPAETGDSVDFIDPLKNIYRNSLFNYQCSTPPGIVAEEFAGPQWIVLALAEGEIAIRYLDAYYGTRETPDVYIEEILPEIFVSFSNYETILDETVTLNDGREGYKYEIDATLNGVDWSGIFIGFASDNGDPFLVSILAPVEEFANYRDAFDNMWMSFTFNPDI